MIGEVMSNMKFKVSSDANDAPPCVGSILSAHVIAFGLKITYAARTATPVDVLRLHLTGFETAINNSAQRTQ